MMREFVNSGRALEVSTSICRFVVRQCDAAAVIGQGDGTSHCKTHSVVFRMVAKLYLDPFAQGQDYGTLLMYSRIHARELASTLKLSHLPFQFSITASPSKRVSILLEKHLGQKPLAGGSRYCEVPYASHSAPTH